MIIMNGHAEHNEQPQGRLAEDRQAEVWACLKGVTDPELDESVTELNFVTRVEYAGQPHKGRKADGSQGVGSTNSTNEGG